MLPIIGVILSVFICVISILILWITSSVVLDKKKISNFIPFILFGVFFGFIASMGFPFKFSTLDLFFVKLIWLVIVVYLAVNIRRQKWN